MLLLTCDCKQKITLIVVLFIMMKAGSFNVHQQESGYGPTGPRKCWKELELHVAKWINLKNIMLVELEKQVLEGYRKEQLLCNM